MQKLTFYQRFEADILSGKKTITIRNKSENDYVPGTIVRLFTYEEDREFGSITILSVEPILFNQLNNEHAQQENMSLVELKKTIEQIYPSTQKLYVISFRLL
jgi:uncharacterized protein YqfB (UPF0267 family)